MPSNAYVLGGDVFTAKAHAERRARAILHGGTVPRRLENADAAFVHDLLALHERAAEKIGPGIKALWVKANVYGDPGFFVERVDGTWIDLSYKKCLTPISRRTQVYTALRRAVAPQMHAVKAAFFLFGPAPCALSGELITWDEAHVDHAYPRTFTALVSAFLEGRGETIDDVPIGPHPSGQGVIVSDAAWAADWEAFHTRTASLRVVKAELNIARGARA